MATADEAQTGDASAAAIKTSGEAHRLYGPPQAGED